MEINNIIKNLDICYYVLRTQLCVYNLNSIDLLDLILEHHISDGTSLIKLAPLTYENRLINAYLSILKLKSLILGNSVKMFLQYMYLHKDIYDIDQYQSLIIPKPNKQSNEQTHDLSIKFLRAWENIMKTLKLMSKDHNMDLNTFN